MKYFVTIKEDNYIDDLSLETKSGYTEVDVPLTSVQYFTRWFNHYRLIDGQIQGPGNLPSLDVDYLKGLVDNLGNKLIQATEKLDKQNVALEKSQGVITTLTNKLNDSDKTIEQLKQMAGKLTDQIVTSNKTIKQLQELSGKLTKQIVDITNNQNK